jgi:hypothetical protein
MATVRYTADDPEVETFLANAMKVMQECSQPFDEQELRDMIAGALGKWTPGEVVVPKANVHEGEGLKAATPTASKKRRSTTAKSDRYWSETPEDTAVFDWYINGRRSGSVEGNMLIVGPSGSGKTEGVIHAAERLNVPLYIVDCPSITTIEKWVGHKEIDHTGTHFVLSEIMEYFRAIKHEPGIVLFDEVTRLHATFHNILLPIFDGRRRIFIPEAHDYIDVHPQVAFVATANIGGRYTGTFNMDQAMRERFGFTIERTWPSADEEIKILSSRYPTIPSDKVKLLVDIAIRSRQKWMTQEISTAISTRMLVNAGQVVRDGASVARALELTTLPNYSQDGGQASERSIIEGIIEGKAPAKK